MSSKLRLFWFSIIIIGISTTLVSVFFGHSLYLQLFVLEGNIFISIASTILLAIFLFLLFSDIYVAYSFLRRKEVIVESFEKFLMGFRTVAIVAVICSLSYVPVLFLGVVILSPKETIYINVMLLLTVILSFFISTIILSVIVFKSLRNPYVIMHFNIFKKED